MASRWTSRSRTWTAKALTDIDRTTSTNDSDPTIGHEGITLMAQFNFKTRASREVPSFRRSGEPGDGAQ
jgi:hypothetical protein